MSFEKLPSFKVLACSVVEFWAIYWAWGGKHPPPPPPPSAYRVKGVSTNVTLKDFKELLDHNKITHAEAERMKSKRSGRDLPFIKTKCEKQAEALISGD